MGDQSDERRKEIRRTYGRGFVDALKSVGIENPGEFVNLNRLRAKEQGLNGQARKTYEVLQVQTSMTLQEVMQALHAKGQKPDYKIIQACLSEIVEQGLAKMPVQGRYQRIALAPVGIPTPVSSDSVVERLASCIEGRSGEGSKPALTTIERIKENLTTASDLIAEAAGLLDVLDQENNQKLQAAQKVLAAFDVLDELRKK